MKHDSLCWQFTSGIIKDLLERRCYRKSVFPKTHAQVIFVLLNIIISNTTSDSVYSTSVITSKVLHGIRWPQSSWTDKTSCTCLY